MPVSYLLNEIGIENENFNEVEVDLLGLTEYNNGDRSIVLATSRIGGRNVIDEEAWISFEPILRNGIFTGINGRVNVGAVVTAYIDGEKAVGRNFVIERKKFIREIKKKVLGKSITCNTDNLIEHLIHYDKKHCHRSFAKKEAK